MDRLNQLRDQDHQKSKNSHKIAESFRGSTARGLQPQLPTPSPTGGGRTELRRRLARSFPAGGFIELPRYFETLKQKQF